MVKKVFWTEFFCTDEIGRKKIFNNFLAFKGDDFKVLYYERAIFRIQFVQKVPVIDKRPHDVEVVFHDILKVLIACP